MSGRPDGQRPAYGDRGRPASRRQWGWHRLTPEWAARVVAASAVRPGDLVVDVGAGTGALTAPLLAAGVRVIAVELNPHRAAVLKARFGADVTVIRTDLRNLRLPRRPFRVVASPPYALSTETLALLTSTERLLSADLVLQRAAAHRFAASPRKGRHRSRYTFAVGISVPRRAFVPPPAVDSAVLLLRRR